MSKIPTTISKRIHLVFLFLLFSCSFIAKGQEVVMVKANVSVLPPFSNNLNEYTDKFNRVIVSLQNVNPTGGDVSVWLRATISDGNNIIISTDPAKKPLQAITFNNDVIRVLTFSELKDILGVNNLIYSGISKASVLNNGLPEGTYTLCIEAYNFQNDALISATEPMGCSNMFPLLSLEPPTIQQPFCEETLKDITPQQLFFTWMASPGTPATTKYAIRMTEVLPEGRSPYEAMNSATYPYFFEQTEISGTTAIYSTAQPTLIKGHSYAFTVTASDPLNNTFFKNNGQSEVCWFKWGSNDTSSIASDTIPFEKPKIPTIVKGTLNYSYENNGNPAFPLKNTTVALKVVYKKKNERLSRPEKIDMYNLFQNVNGRPQYQIQPNTGNLTFTGNQSTLGKNITINNNFAQLTPGMVPGIGDSNITIANDSGKFEFHLALYAEDSIGSYIPNPLNPNEKLYKTYSIQIYNPYFMLPETEFEIDPGQTKELGLIMAKVLNYQLNVNVQQIYNGKKGKILENMEVYLLRKNKNDDLPEKEGDLDAHYPIFNGYRVVSKATTAKTAASQSALENSVIFPNLVKNMLPGDHYVIYAKKHTGNQAYIRFIGNDNETDYQNLSYNPHVVGSVAPTLQKTIYVVFSSPPKSKVTGNLAYKFYNSNTKPAKPLANTKVSLIVQYKFIGKTQGKDVSEIFDVSTHPSNNIPKDNNTILQTVTTNSNGDFTFNFSNVDSLKVTNPHFTIHGDEVTQGYDGKLERVIRLKVENPYFCSPDEDIEVQPWANYNAGNLNSYVISYQLKLKAVIADAFKKHLQTVNVSDTSGAISGVKFTLYRNFRDEDIPSNEGSGMNQVRNIDGKNRIVVSEDYNLDDGTFTFKDLVRSNYPDDYYMIMATTSETSANDKNYWKNTSGYPIKFGADRLNQAIIRHPANTVMYNSKYISTEPYLYYSKKQFEQPVKMSPRNPRVAGRVVSTAAPNGVRNALVFLSEDYKNQTDKIQAKFTDTLGYFPPFNDLKVELLDPNDNTSNIIGPSRTLRITCNGYQNSNIIDLGIMTRGTQYNNPNLQLIPLGTGASGYVRDSVPNINNDDLQGDPLASRVKIGNGAFVNTYNSKPYETPGEHQKFKLDAANGNQLLTIVPFDPAFPARTFNVNITKPNQWLGTFEFSKMQHKVSIKVVKRGIGRTTIPILGAKVKILNMEISTNTSGEAYFEYTNNSTTNFVAYITPGTTQTFVPRSYAFANSESQGLQKIILLVEDGAVLKGKVLSASTQLPLKGAKVFVDQGTGGNQYFVYTNNQGEYQLNGIPRNPSAQTIKAVYSESGPTAQTYIGKSLTITLPASGNPANVDFALSTFNSFDITSLLGMPIEIDSLKIVDNSTVEVTGAFIHLKSNPNFKLLDSNLRLPFHRMKVQKGAEKNSQGVFIGVPFVNDYGLDIYSVPIQIFSDFNGELRPQNSVIHFEKDYPTGKGKITGLIRIIDNSFNFPSSYMTISNSVFYLGNYGQSSTNTKTILPAFKAPGVDYPKSRFTICTYDASGFNFKLLGFNGITSAFAPTESYIVDDTVALFIRLKTTLPFDPPIPLDITAGKVIMHHDRIDPIDNYNNLDFNLETWAVKGNGWKLATNSGGILIKAGTIQTGILDVPFTNMTITTDDLICDDYKVSDLSLGGVTPLVVDPNIPPGNKKFVYDPKVGEDQKGHYKLIILSNGVNPVARFGGGALMEGMGVNDRFNIYVISLLSNGLQQFSFGDAHPAIPLYSVAKFKPLTIFAKDNSFNMLGTVDFEIPRTANNYQCNIVYKKGPSKALLTMLPVGLVINGPGNVVFSAGSNQSLNANGYTTDGFVQEEGIFKLDAKLNRPSNFNNITIKVDSNSNQVLKISSISKLQKVWGKMAIKNNDWDYFNFGGTLFGASGIGNTAPQKLNFTVFGDIKATNQSIGVQNIDLSNGFDGISLTYDFKNSRLTGELEFDTPFSGLNVKGVANVLFDSQGWYFLAGGSVDAPGIGKTNAGILLGDYPSFTSAMQSTLMQFCYNKNVPCDYKNGVHGFFFSGTKTVPIVNIPNVHMNILVASMDLGFECGVDARMYMNFTNASTTIGMGAMAFAHAYFVLESCFCTSISAEARAELLVEGLYDTGTKSFDLHGCGSVSIDGDLEQCIGAFGCCSPSCLSASVKKSLKVEMSLSSQNGIHGLSVGTGDCSSPSGDPCK